MSQPTAVAAEAPTIWFSRSKTRAPRFSIPLVERRRLLSVLDSALDKPLACLVAPAGFGKSTLLAQWRETLIDRDIPCAWINLDENDREIRQFYAYLTFALDDVGISLGSLKRAAENGFVDMSSSSIVTSLLTAIAELDDHMVLVLDDYHRAACEQIDDFVTLLSDQFGDKIHIAIGSREPVDINLPTMLVSGRAIEIPSFDLRFSDREVREAMGAEFDQEAVDVLQQQVEGWPVAVQMTKLLGDKDRIDVAPLRHTAGSQGHVADYLVTNVLRSQPEELQEFLLETSILKSFNAALADAVCEHDESQSLIRQLEALQALVVPLDDEREWFRYHHLFAECLNDLLKQEDPDKFAELHRRAARWCGENRMIAEAVDYANSIEDYALSKQMIKDNGLWLSTEQFGGVGYFSGLFTNIPEEEIVKDPRMLFYKANTCVMAGDSKKALHYHNLAEAVIEKEGLTPDVFLDRLTIGTFLLAQVEFEMERDGGWMNERLAITDALAEENPEAYALSCIIRTILAIQSLSYGDFDAARKRALAAKADSERVVALIPFLYRKVCCGLIEFWANAPDKARRHFRDAGDKATDAFGEQSNFRVFADLFLTVTDYWESGVDADPDHGLEQVIMRTIDGEGGYDVYTIGFDAIVHDALCHGDFDKAEKFVGNLEQWTDQLAIERLVQFAQPLRLDCATARNDLASAEQLFAAVQNWLDVGEKELDDLGWFLRTTAAYSCARYLAAVGRNEEALACVENGLDEVDQLDVVLMRVRGNILKASLLERAQRPDEALEVLARAIEDAARIGCSRSFARDVTHDLAQEAANRIVAGNHSIIVKNFARKLTASYSKELFTVREKEVLQGLADGKSNKEIARVLDLTDNTVKFHVRNIYRKLEVSKRVQAVEKARKLQIVQ